MRLLFIDDGPANLIIILGRRPCVVLREKHEMGFVIKSELLTHLKLLLSLPVTNLGLI